MFTAKIKEVTKKEDNTVDSLFVEYTDGEIIVNETYSQEDFNFQTKDDIMNLLVGKVDALDAQCAIVDVVESLVNDNKIVEEYKKEKEEEVE